MVGNRLTHEQIEEVMKVEYACFLELTPPPISSKVPVESAVCLVVAAVFKTVEGQSVLGGFNSFPLRHFSLVKKLTLAPASVRFQVSPTGKIGLSRLGKRTHYFQLDTIPAAFYQKEV